MFVQGLLEFLGLLVLDIQVLKGECLLGRDDPVNNYILRLVAYPIFAMLLLSALLLSRALGQRNVTKDRILNSQGVVLLVVYISLVLSVAIPFQCVPNPNDSKSLATNPGVVSVWRSGVFLSL